MTVCCERMHRSLMERFPEGLRHGTDWFYYSEPTPPTKTAYIICLGFEGVAWYPLVAKLGLVIQPGTSTELSASSWLSLRKPEW